jgi:cytochrome P450
MVAVPKRDDPPPAFNPRDSAFIRDPYPTYDALRRGGPVQWLPAGYWIATGYEVCATILKDKRLGRRFETALTQRYGRDMMGEPVFRMLSRTMLMEEPPVHTRLRGLVTKAFTAKRVEQMRPRIRGIVRDLLDRLEPQRGMDVMRDFAHILPVTVICDMLGIPKADRSQFLDNNSINTRVFDPDPMTRAEIDEANATFSEQWAYFDDLCRRRHDDPADDLITALVHVKDEQGALSLEEILANIWLLFAAGHETTRNLIGNGLLALHRHPRELARLRADPGLMPGAVEEMLRYDSPVQFSGRTAYEEIRLGDVVIGEGQLVLCLIGAGNRDSARFADPDRLDVGRPGVRPLSFGGGIHYCLGAQLSRIEAEEAFAGLLGRLPGMALEEVEAPQWRSNFNLRGLARLPVRW